LAHCVEFQYNSLDGSHLHQTAPSPPVAAIDSFMPSVTYNGQCFSIDGRRFWILAASVQYSRIPSACWESRLRAVRQAGFNTIETAVPWGFHEPRKGRYSFDGDADLHRFVELCGTLGLKVILRAGPNIGAGFDGGGLPGWLIDQAGIVIRESDESFLEQLSKWFRKLTGVISDLQATQGGPIILVQSEHAWTCASPSEAEAYLHEVTRFLRESGIAVPIINANDLWLESPGTIDTWRGYDDLLAHLRQLRTLQPEAPRLISCLDVVAPETWGSGPRG
jgi:beta-galactosidase